MKQINVPIILLLIAVFIAACDPINSPLPTLQTMPHSWIDAPLDASTVPPNPAVEVTSHSSDPLHIVQVEFSVNGQVAQTSPNVDTSQTLVLTKQMWLPPAPGNYTLMVRAQNSAGVWGEYAQVVVTVQGAGTQPPQVAPPPFVIPSATVVTKPGVPTPSPLPAASITFYADTTALTQGHCTTIHWQVTNVSQVSLDNAPVNLNGSKQDCPNQTTTHTLRIVTLDKQNVQRTLTINVVPPTRTSTLTPTRTLPPPPLPVGCNGTPVISSFSASPSSISRGGSSTLNWGAVTNADSVEIDNGIGGIAAPGSRNVSPSVTTVYVLTARCKGATAIARAIVTVIQPPSPTLSLRQLPSPTPTRTPIIVR